MKHPIFKIVGNDYKSLIKYVTSMDGDEFDKLLDSIEMGDTEKASMIYRTQVALLASLIAKTGYIHIDASKDEWFDNVSMNTIMKLNAADFKFPFKAGTIQIGEIIYGFTLGDDRFLNILLVDIKHSAKIIAKKYGEPTDEAKKELSKLKERLQIIENETLDFSKNITIEELTKNIKEKRTLFAILSVFMYIVMAKSSNKYSKNVVERRIKGSHSKKRGIPKHYLNYITVKQGEPSKHKNEAREQERNKSDKFWLVRGHWRNQWYAKEKVNKPKWIEPHWRGSGKDEVKKIYNIDKN